MRQKSNKSPDVDCCATCRYWREDMTEGMEGRSGECRRYPAKVVADGEGVYSVNPTRPADEWCGEHGQRVQ